MISFDEFKKNAIVVGVVADCGKTALIDFGARTIECSAAGLKLGKGDKVVCVIEGNKAGILGTKNPDGSCSLLTAEDAVEPGTPAE